MPEESAPVPASNNKTSVLDKNVPNPLAKNPNIHTHKVFASVALILIGVIVILSILAFFYRDQVADLFNTKTTGESTTTTKVSTSSAEPATPSATTKKDEPKNEIADWKLYNNSIGSYNLLYPPNYKKVSLSKEQLDPYTRQDEFQSPDYDPATSGPSGSTTGKGASFYVDVCDPGVYCYPNIEDVNSGKQIGKMSNLRNATVDSVSGKRYNFEGSHGERYDVVELKAKGKIYKLVLYHGRHDLSSLELNNFNLFVSTFKFL